jgi:hypothetical protein
VKHGETCETPVTTVATPVDTTSNTDSICHARTTCGGCFERTECGVCTFLNGDTACRARELTRNGETGPHFCEREHGTWSVARDSCEGATVVGAVNNGEVSRDTVNHELETASSAPGYIIIVTVITQAEPNEDGSAHFQIFIDVTSDLKPNAEIEERICGAVKASLVKILGVLEDDVHCDLHDAPTKKRATFSYVADMTVGGPTDNIGQSRGALIVPLIALTAVSSVLSLF